MLFYSTKHESPSVDLKTAVLRSLPADKGLYMPEKITPLSASFFENLEQYSFPEMCFHFAKTLLAGTVSDTDLKEIIDDAVNFEAPVIPFTDNLSVLELTHGPSLAFKDFGARFMSRLMSKLVAGDERNLDILVATSGDTGGAVALGFYNTPNIRVTILYPSGKVSDWQEKQLTTLGGNIRAIEVDGTFDDCQALVKEAFLDKKLNEKLNLSSANSINIARLVPQCFYYVWAYKQLKDKSKPLAMCVPSGNFGNITAGLIAKKMGLPIETYIAANNANHVFADYYKTGNYAPKKSVATWSNAMDVGAPSNFQRMMDLFENKHEEVQKTMAAFWYDDEKTLEGVKELHDRFDYVACPHTAVGYLAAKEFLAANPNYQVIFQATAHPSKFLDIVEKTLGEKVEIPAALLALADREKVATAMDVSYADFKEYLIKND